MDYNNGQEMNQVPYTDMGMPYNQKPSGEEPMSLGEWMLTLLVIAIPCVGIIMLFVWGFGDGNTSRKNFCRAALIYMLISVVLSIIFVAVLGAGLFGALSSFSYSL